MGTTIQKCQNRHRIWKTTVCVVYPTFKGSECPSRFFVLRALHTTRSRGPRRHRAAGDGVGYQRAARFLVHLSLIGSGPRGQTRPTLPSPLGSLSCLCSL